MKARGLQDQSEDAIVLAWREYYAKNFVLSRYPHDDAAITTAIEKTIDPLIAKVSKDDFKAKLETLFLRAKKASLEKVKTYKLDAKPLAEITARIEGIHLYWAKNLKDSKFKSMPLEFADWGIAYDPSQNEINIGIKSLAYPNDETILSVFAHEIGHAIDSCRWGAYFTGPWAFEKVGECLRSPASAGAKKRDDTKIQAQVKAGRLSAELAEALRQNPTCNKIAYPPIGVQADQLPETFADWFSAEVIATFGIDNDLEQGQGQNLGLGFDITKLRSDLCEARALNAGSSYISNHDRLERVYFAHPELRMKANLEKAPDLRYCSM
jgi:hypothetical protein